MAARFLVVPQWQASGSSRAMRLVDGAEAIRGDLPSATTTTVVVPLESGDSQGTTVNRLSSIALVRDRVAQALAEQLGPTIVIGGDCGVEVGAIGHVSDRDVTVVWFDAHPDLNTPESSPSHAFNGMVLRTILGDGPAQLVPAVPLSPTRLVLVGARSFDPAEDEYIAGNGVRSVGVDGFSAEALVAAVEATGATSVYVHIDLDVLDPGEFAGLGDPAPFGLGAGALIDALKVLLARFALAGAAITEFAPASVEAAVEDLPTILRIVGALAAAS
ncbi:MAG: arginase family protein [Rhodoglobus sp.]